MGSVPVIMRFARNCEEEGKFEEPKLSAMSGALGAACSLLVMSGLRRGVSRMLRARDPRHWIRAVAPRVRC